MTDTVTTRVLANDLNYSLLLTSLSDGTGEAAAVKADISSLTGPDGFAPSSLRIDRVRWTINGFEYAKIAWDATTDDTALILGVGEGELDFRDVGGLRDPGSTGSTGDVVLTTPAGSAGDSYTIILEMTKIQ